MTPKQKAAIKHNIKLKWLHGEITQTEFDDLVEQLNIMAGYGATYEYANQTLGMYKKKGKTSASSAPKPQPAAPMTKEEAKALKAEIKQQYVKGEITLDEWDQKTYAVTEALNAGKSLKEAQVVAGVSIPQAAPKGMSHEEYIGLWEELKKKQKAGLITKDEYKALGGKLDAAYANKKTVAEVQGEIGLDPGTKATDAAVLKLGKEFKNIYSQAASEMQVKLDAFLKKHEKEFQELNKKLLDGTITQDEYKRLQNLTLRKSGMEKQIEQLSGVVLNANQKAMAAVNGEMLGVFADNANWQSYQLEQNMQMNLMFAIYDENTVENLIQKNPELMPRKEVNGAKDKAWNQKQMANAVTQAILQGESIPKLAERIAKETAESNEKAMVRYARTAMTCAQNSGRIEMLHRAQGLGIKVKKRWLATLDSRTRDSHQQMDGVSVGVDEEFHTPLGSKMQYPGDPAGKGGDVWNCRCTLVYDYEGFPNDPAADVRRDNETGDVIANMPYADWKAAKKGGVLNDLSLAKQELGVIQKEFIAKKVSETKVYKDLWKDPVTLADYPAKKGSIQAKKDYYTAEIDKYKQAQANGSSWATDEKIKELEKKKRLLTEFEKHGEILEKRNKALKKVQDLYAQSGIGKAAAAPAVAKKPVKKAAPASNGTSTGAGSQTGAQAATPAQKGQFAPDAWDEKAKKDAKLYRSRSEADKVLRPELDRDWDQLTDEEKYAVWEYTRNSNPMNKSLSGYHDSWSRSNFIGYDKTDWGHEDSWRSIGVSAMNKFATNGHVNYKRAITDLTNAIEKTPLKKGMWLVRGSDENGLAGMLEGGGMNFNQVTSLFNGRHSISDIKKALVGQVARNHAFTSTGIASDAGFSGNIKYEIYAPAGTKCIYAEPQSYYGRTSDKKIYKKGQSYGGVGSEAEVIVQRGTAYRITDVVESGYGYTVKMEIVEQPDYFTHGDEDTFNGGKTRHKR